MFDKNTPLPIASDHGGYEMKQYIVEALEKEGYNVKDMGTNGMDSVNYPDLIHPLAKAVNDGTYPKGIILCGSGNGAQMTANKYPNVRAGLCWTVEQAELTRLHNDANIISLPGRFVSFEDALKMVHIFLNTEFEGGRHQRRVDAIAIK